MPKIFYLFLFCFIGIWSRAQSCTGYWITIDDATGLKKSIVELYKKEGVLYGKVVYIYNPRSRQRQNLHLHHLAQWNQQRQTECEGLYWPVFQNARMDQNR